MIAILQYGQFTTTMDIKEPVPYINVPKPFESPVLYQLGEPPNTTEKRPAVLQFDFVRHLDEKHLLYMFRSEV